jgi:hypothetical protein
MKKERNRSWARDEGREIREVEKLVLNYVALNPQLKSARNIRQLAVRCMERFPPGEDRVRYDHLFDPGEPENKEFWIKIGPYRNELVNVFVALNESDRSDRKPSKLILSNCENQSGRGYSKKYARLTWNPFNFCVVHFTNAFRF